MIFQQPQPHDWTGKWAIYHPNGTAIKDAATEEVLTYQQFNARANRLAHHFQQQRLQTGDRVAVLAENGIHYLLLFAAAQKLGLILVPLNYRLTGKELSYLLEKTRPSLVLVANDFVDQLMACEGTLPRAIFNISELNRWCPADTELSWSNRNPSLTIQEDHPLFILFTSGTTGYPKGAIYTHRMLLWNSINTALSLEVNTQSRTINCMPPFHTGGWNVLTTPFLHHGGYSCLLRKFDAGQVLQLLEEERVTIFMGVPTMLAMLADHPNFESADLSSLKYLIVGGEPMPIPLIERWHAKGIPVRQGYGMTEVGPNLTSLHQDDAIRKKGSIGRPNFYVETRIVDEQGQDLPPGTAGELVLRGPMVTPGYWEDEAATAKAIKNGWFHTGDRVLCDEEGYLFVVDRIKNMYISGGENVYPAEVERVLQTHPAVEEVAIIGVPDEKWGEVGCAFVVLSSTSNTTGADLQDFCRQQLAKYKVPKHVRLVAELPKNDTGKIDRKGLAFTNL